MSRRAAAPPTGPVLFVSYSGLWGGAEQLLVDAARSLRRPAVLLCPGGELATRARAAGIAVLESRDRPRELRGGARVAATAASQLAGHAGEIRSVAASLRPAAVVAFGMRSAMAASSVLGSGRGGHPLLFEHVDMLPEGAVARAVRAAAKRVDRVIAISDAVARDLDPERRLGPIVRVARPGIDVARHTPSPPPADPPTALLLGAIVGWKRPDLALEAVAIAARELPELKLVVAGHSVGEESERLLEELRRRASRDDLAGRVTFAGALADPRDALTGASCLLHCSDDEPYGLVLLEAMATGRPVVAPRSGGPVEIVAPDCGRLYTPGDAGAAARALVETLGDADALRRAGQAARAHAADHFNLAESRRRWLDAAHPLLKDTAPDPQAGADLTLVTVTHNSAAELDRLLASVARNLPAAAIVVVDSGSSDDSAERARGHAGATVLELDNVGYGRAANAGLEEVKTPACVVLNPDVELVDGSLAALAAEALRADAPERLLAPLVLHPDGSRQDSVHPEPVSAATALSAIVPPAALPPPLRRAVQPWRSDQAREVAWPVGCCIVARTETLRRLGPFDGRIFLYGEDLELGLRARDAGVQSWWWPDARVIHYEAHTSARSFGGEPFEMLAEQRHAVVADRRGERAARWDDRLQAATFINRIALKTLTRRSNERERRQLRAVRGARRARLGGD